MVAQSDYMGKPYNRIRIASGYPTANPPAVPSLVTK